MVSADPPQHKEIWSKSICRIYGIIHFTWSCLIFSSITFISLHQNSFGIL
jgi:hypothetical protein